MFPFIVYTLARSLNRKKVKATLSDLKEFLATERLLKKNKKCFLFYLKSNFRSQDI